MLLPVTPQIFFLRRDLLIFAVIVLVAVVTIMVVYLLFFGTAHAEITSVSTDKDLYHSNEIMNVTVSVTSSRWMDGVVLSFEGIQDSFGDLQLSAKKSANLTPGTNYLTYEHQLPPCSHCAGLDPGPYQFNVSLTRDGVLLSTQSHQIQLEQ